MFQNVEIYVGNDGIRELVEFCRGAASGPFTIVADVNTQRALGERVSRALHEAGFRVSSVVLEGEEIIADEKYLLQVMIQAPPGDQTFIAVGSGTLTDITRYVSFRTGDPFISVPSAASVDGFLSTGAPLVIRGVKDTYKTHGPIGVFADLPTLVDAPPELRAAGFGDIIGKSTSLADWKLGSLLWEEPYDESAEQRTRLALNRCVEAADEIATGSEQGIRLLINGLLESGMSMLEMGNSLPASGSEHHCSHYWEMQLLRENRPAILHGAKVGYATTLIARLYDHIRNLRAGEVKELIAASDPPDRKAAIQDIENVYGPSAPEIMRIQTPFLNLSEEDHERLKQRILENWQSIQFIAAEVIAARDVIQLLKRVGAPTDWRSLGLDKDMVKSGLYYGHYLRNRFTVIKLFRILGLDVGVDI